MKIKSLSIRNVRGIKSLDMDPEKLTFITGPSGSGKSSLLDGLRYGLTGKLGKENIRADAMTAAVSMDIERMGIISRSVDINGKTKVKFNNKTTTAKSVAEQFAALFNVSPTSMNLLTSSELLEHMLGKDLAEYLLTEGFLKNDMTLSHLLALNPLPADVVEELKKILPMDPKVITLEDIESAYQNCRNSRTALKKMYTEERVLAQYSGYTPEHSSAAISRGIANIQKEIAAEQQKAIDYQKAKKSCESILKNIEDTKTQLKSYESIRAVTATEKELAAENKANAQKLIEVTSTAISSATKDVAFIQSTLDALNTTICPISKELVCTTDKTSVHAALEQSLKEKTELLETLTKQLEENKAALASAEKQSIALVKQEGNYKIRMSLMAQLEKLKETKVMIPDEPKAQTVLELQAKLSRLQEMLDAAKKSEEAKRHQARADGLEETYRIMDVLCNELAVNGGIRKQVLAHSIGPLEAWCNEMLKEILPKYTLHFDESDSFVVVMRDSDGNQVNYEGLSTGEQLRTLFVIMAMLNELNNTRIFVLDNLNALDVNTFEEFIRFIEKNATSYDHVFLAGIDHAGFVDAFNKCTIPHRCIAL